MTAPLAAILRDFGAGGPQQVAETGIAIVWKVDHGGQPAALKIYKDRNMQDEAPGIALMQALNGRGTARILDCQPGAMLMEWLDGPTLGDLSRAGKDETAARRLGRVARRIHGADIRLPLPSLSTRFAALFDLHIAPGWPSAVQRNFHCSRETACTLLAGQGDLRPLHGDLHHDNIIATARGDIAFDAKGVIGDPAYDLANAFLNPVNAAEITRNPDRIRRCATMWGAILAIAPQRLLGWAIAHCGLAMAWTDTPSTSPHHAVLSQLAQIRNALTD